MRAISRFRTAGFRRLSTLGAAVGVALLVAVWAAGRPDDGVTVGADSPTQTTVSPLADLDPQGRCASAAALVTAVRTWPLVCRWRQPGDLLQGQAFPPPAGDPPYDNPHIEIYVDPAQSREDLARAIAHELGHMHHTRDARFVPEWLADRNLAPDTPWEIWTEDYAEVFTALFAPPTRQWRAPTTRPNVEAMERLRSRFFAGA